MKPGWRKIVLIAFLGAVAALVYTSGITGELTLENLKAFHVRLDEFVERRYLLSAGIFIALYIFVAGLALPGPVVLTIASGYLYGTVAGAAFVNIGATAGATIAFLISRYVAGRWVQEYFNEKLAWLNREIDEHGWSYLLTLRLIPLFPFFLVNILSGLTKIEAWTFVWTTSIGTIPGTLAFSYAGSRLNKINSLSDILSPDLFLALLILGLIALAPVIYRKITKTG